MPVKYVLKLMDEASVIIHSLRLLDDEETRQDETRHLY